MDAPRRVFLRPLRQYIVRLMLLVVRLFRIVCGYVGVMRIRFNPLGCSFLGRLTAALILITGLLLLFIIYNTIEAHLLLTAKTQQRLTEIQIHVEFMDSLYRSREEDMYTLQTKIVECKSNITSYSEAATDIYKKPHPTYSPEVQELIKNLSGTQAAKGTISSEHMPLRMPFLYHMMPHLLADPYSLKPAYHLKGNRTISKVIIGVPTVKRDKESYLMVTLTHLVNGLSEDEKTSTLIVVFVGETDMLYVLNTARQIESNFPKELASGLIEVLAPSPSYYPDLNALEPTLGDPVDRFQWRTKQNLDSIYLMSYAQPRGIYYLMLEDDVISKMNYMRDIRRYTNHMSMVNPQWIILEFCQVGGIAKLFRSTELINFVTYVQLFYVNMPIDWLIDSYITDKICTVEKTTKQCARSKGQVRFKYENSLFQHIGIYSSLKGKIQRIKDTRFGNLPEFHPHTNPTLLAIRSDMEEYLDHTLRGAYDGNTFYWGIQPKKDEILEFCFKKPVALKRFLLRSGNVNHLSDRFYHAVVEVKPIGDEEFIQVGAFDESGVAEGELKRDFRRITSLRVRIEEDSKYWVILSEILIEPYNRRK